MNQNDAPKVDAEEKKVRTFAHRVRVPPLTDTVELVGVYRGLFNACRVNCDRMSDMFPIQTRFNHPIEESNTALNKEYAETMTLISSAMAAYGSVSCVDCRVATGSATFMFEYTE